MRLDHATPSVKGVVLQLAVDAVRQLLAQGRVRREALEVRLDPEDLEILEQKVLPGMWYPVASVGRLLEVSTQDAQARGGVQALVEVGARSASRLLDSELYGAFLATAKACGERAGPVLVRLAPLLLNFSRWSYHEGACPGRSFRVIVEEAGELPEILRFLAQGFILYLAERTAGGRVRLTSARPAADRIVYTGLRTSPSA